MRRRGRPKQQPVATDYWPSALIEFILDFASTQTGKKGLAYLQSGNVLAVDATRASLALGGEITATVTGTYSAQYAVDLELMADGLGTECTCPVGYACKHCYAVALAVLGEAVRRKNSEAMKFVLRMPQFSRIPFAATSVKFTNIEDAFSPVTNEPPPPKVWIDSENGTPWWRRFLDAPDANARRLILNDAFLKRIPGLLKHEWRHQSSVNKLMSLENPIDVLAHYEEEFQRFANFTRLLALTTDSRLEQFLASEEARSLRQQLERRVLEDRLLNWLDPPDAANDTPRGKIDIEWSIVRIEGRNPVLCFQLFLTTQKLLRSPRHSFAIYQLYRDIESGKRRFSHEEETLVGWISHRLSDLDSSVASSPLRNRSSQYENYIPIHNAMEWLTQWGFKDFIRWSDGGPVVFDPNPARLGLAPKSDTDSTPVWTVFHPPRNGDPGQAVPYKENTMALDETSLINPNKEANLLVRQGDILRRVETGGMPVNVLASVFGLPEAPVERLRSTAAGAVLAQRLFRGAPAGVMGNIVQSVPVQPIVEIRYENETHLSVAALARSSDGMLFHRLPAGHWVAAGTAAASTPVAEMEEIRLPASAAEAGVDVQMPGPLPPAALAPHVISVIPRHEDVAALDEWLRGLIPPEASAVNTPNGAPALSWKARNNAIGHFLRLWPIRPRGGTWLGDRAFQRLLLPRNAPGLKVKIDPSGVDFLQVSIEMEKELEAISLDEVNAALASSNDHLLLLPGSGVYRREDLDQYRKRIETFSHLGLEIGGGAQRLHALQLAGSASEELLELGGADDRLRELVEHSRRLIKSFKGVPPAPVNAATASLLRPYQRVGADFITWAAKTFGGALLADDMGLGKTIQVLAALTVFRAKKGKPRPSLVVCPASVAHNWEREVRRFAPELKTVVVESGKARQEILKRLGDYDLVIKNYSLTRRDADVLREIDWLLLCVDEAQAIKNPGAEITKTVKSLKARYRIALTGTPIENRLSDLWSIIDFTVPGYLYSLPKFEERMKGEGAALQQRILRSRLRPLLIRRLKSEVAPELPPRIEERRDCAMTTGQHKAYLTEVRRTRLLLDGIKDDDLNNKGRIMILAALTRLRQICCDPGLVDLPETGSGKVDELLELLPPILESGQKVLLFSQFVRMLTRIRKVLNKAKIPNFTLTGETTPAKRQGIIREFEDAAEPGVFLISLKAGGTGLNLTAASHVILFDPWWNPAVEAQAIDRTHRIGQDKTVVAFRLVTLGTIEERIIELQEKKRGLVQNILEEESFNRTLNREDFEFLLGE